MCLSEAVHLKMKPQEYTYTSDSGKVILTILVYEKQVGDCDND